MEELKSDFEMQKFFKTVEVKGVSDIKLLIKINKSLGAIKPRDALFGGEMILYLWDAFIDCWDAFRNCWDGFIIVKCIS